tara:strand:- start:57 stop:527 length:471 start_codon:yes stop_codon:yes gene_type:complete
MGLEVRPSLPDEFWRLEELIPKLSQETRFRNRPIDVRKLNELFDHQFMGVISVICYYALMDDGKYQKCVGFGAFTANPSFFGNDLTATDLILYVLPEHRGSTIAIRILKEYEKWAISQNVDEISLGISTGINVERTGQFYERLGYRRESVVFVKNP